MIPLIAATWGGRWGWFWVLLKEIVRSAFVALVFFSSGCGGVAFTSPATSSSSDDGDAGDVLEDAASRRPTSSRSSRATPATSAVDARPWGPTCMFQANGNCGALAAYAMRYACGPQWCCNAENACHAGNTGFCSVGACGVGNVNKTCETDRGLMCCTECP